MLLSLCIHTRPALRLKIAAAAATAAATFEPQPQLILSIESEHFSRLYRTRYFKIARLKMTTITFEKDKTEDAEF